MTTTDATSPSSPRMGVAVDERGYAGPVRHGEHDLFGAHSLGVAKLLDEREPAEPDLAPIGATAGDDFERAPPGDWLGFPSASTSRRGLAIERQEPAGPGIEDRDAYGRGFDEDLEVGA